MSLTAFKVFITVTYNGPDAPAAHKTIRRFSAKPGTTLAEFRTILIEDILRRPEGSVAIAVSYKDTDGDVVEVASELEWAEALQQHSGAVASGAAIPILIDATLEGSDPLNSSMIIPCQSNASIHSNTVREVSVGTAPTATAEVASGTVSAALSSAQMQTETPAESAKASPTEPTSDTSAAPPAPTHIMLTNVNADGTTSSHTSVWPTFTAADAPLMALLSQLFSCDAAKELLDPFRRTNFGSLLRRTVDPWTDALKLDIYRSQVRNYVSTQATGLMAAADATGFERALTLLKAAVAVFPDDATLHYHLACAMSLTKASAAAVVDQLRVALAKGYGSIEGIAHDPFFATLRSTSQPEMMNLIGGMDPYVVELLNVYPTITAQEAKDALARNGNNVHRAAAYLADRIFTRMSSEPSAPITASFANNDSASL